MNKLYAVVFDNDPEYPGKLQFCDVSYEEEYLECTGSNYTEDKKHAENVILYLIKTYPNINYRVVEIIVKELK